MPKILLQTVKIISIFLSASMIFWLISFSLILLAMGGRYSIVTESGALVCGIWFFAEEGLLWTLFEFWGVPLTILAASWRTKAFCSEQLRFILR